MIFSHIVIKDVAIAIAFHGIDRGAGVNKRHQLIETAVGVVVAIPLQILHQLRTLGLSAPGRPR